ncbi:MAG: galactose mutarotase [Bacteroidales bacterium]|jgi:aldose 1-epimerase|nr:galactose mutarotase [Bacteroidales bacterium]
MRKLIIFTSIVLIFALGCEQKSIDVEKKVLGENNGSEICTYTLTNKAGNILKVTNFGAKIVGIEVPDKFGNKENVTNGVDNIDAIIKGDLFGGATIGRFANRIANAKFTLDGIEYKLPENNRPNTLHGGPNGWYVKVWDAEILKSKNPTVKFTYISPDMEEGFPGTVNVSVTYTWTDKNEVIIDYSATADKKTVINLTNHAYFNLHGTGKGYIFEHIVTIKASAYTPLDSTKIPTGEIVAVKGTPYDFTEPKTVGHNIGETFGDKIFMGYDDNYVLDNKEEVDAIVYEPKTGRVMEVITDEPGMQFYSGNSIAWRRSLEGGNTAPANIRSGLALETQHFPDSPNKPNFPSTTLNPGEEFKSRTIYRFSVREN